MARKDRDFVSQEDVVFVIGAPRSGTTILYKKLKEHFNVYGFDYETEIFSKKRLSNFRRHSEHPNIEEFISIYDNTSSRAEFFVNIHRKTFNTGRLIEKTPQHLFYIDLLAACFQNALFIHIVRDPRDAFISGYENKNIPQAKNARKYIKYWKQCIHKVERFENIEENRVFTLRYEDFVSRTDMCIEEIGFFLNEKRNKNCKPTLDPRGESSKFSKLNKPIDSNSIGRWKSSTLKHELIHASTVIKQELMKFNYETY